ncbi:MULTISPECIES: hypothetical protein [unclassified Streptomyces]|uniref:hypothetical protein n=1 Tax=unclassified Streptomyces TaxID=2593676 RepID=UPI000A986491|nr:MULTISPECIES: hypothetical protein [unclassified Streptomyces]
MTGTPGTPVPEPEPQPTPPSQRVATGMVIVGLAALVAVVVLALTGHPEATGSAAVIGSAFAGGVSIRVNIRR